MSVQSLPARFVVSLLPMEETQGGRQSAPVYMTAGKKQVTVQRQ